MLNMCNCALKLHPFMQMQRPRKILLDPDKITSEQQQQQKKITFPHIPLIMKI